MTNTPKTNNLVTSTLTVMALLIFAALLYNMYPVIMLAFAAILIALIFNMVAVYFQENTRLNYPLSLTVSIFLIFGSLGIISYLFGQTMSDQLTTLANRLPEAWAVFEKRMDELDAGAQIKEEIATFVPDGGSLVNFVKNVLSGLTGAVTAFILALFGGIYLASRPKVYFKGFLILIPRTVRPRIEDALLRTGQALRLWMGGQLLSMIGIGLLTTLGLWLLDVPSYLALGLITGLLNFVPIVGPILAAVPAILLGLTIDTQTALLILLLYVAVQQIEGWLFQPYIQKRAVNIPAAVTLFSLFAIGGLFGFGGVLIAAPLTVLIVTLVKTLYIKDVLGEDIEVPQTKAFPK